MEGTEVIADALGRVNRIVHRAIDGVSAEMLCQQPSPEANTMAWLVWHLYRVQDHHISDLLGKPQLWVSDGWHEKFGMAQDEKETGNGHTLDQVRALRVDSAELPLAYADAVYERAKQYLATVTSNDLDAEIDEPQYNPLPRVGVRLVSIIADNTSHAGQAMYVRGLLAGFGWQNT
jgi:uncharacterized damage-inducible protein DinB